MKLIDYFMKKFKLYKTIGGKKVKEIEMEEGDLVMLISRKGAPPRLGFVKEVKNNSRIVFEEPAYRFRKPIIVGGQVFDRIQSGNGVDNEYSSSSGGEVFVGSERVSEALQAIGYGYYSVRIGKINS